MASRKAQTIMSKTVKKKGVDLQSFLAKRKENQIKSDIKKPSKDVEKKTTSIAVITKEKKKEVIKDKTPKTQKTKEVSLFKYIDASKVGNPLNLLTFIKWLAMPSEDRNPKTQGELGKVIGTHIDTLTNWKGLVGFWDEVAIYRNQYFRKFTSNVYAGLVKRSKAGDPKAVELFASIFEGFKKGLKVEDTTPERIITDEEKARIDLALKNIGLATIIKHNDVEDEDE